MAERICPACSAVVPPRLKFCRQCGGRVEDAPAPPPDATGPAAPADSGDATMMSSMPRKPADTVPTAAPDNPGDATVIGAFTVRSSEPEPATMAPPADREPATVAPSEADLAKTMMTEPEPPPEVTAPTPTSTGPMAAETGAPAYAGPPSASGEETILGAMPTAAPEPPPPPVEEPEPITDDFDEVTESSLPAPPATTPTLPPPAPPPPPPPPPAPSAAPAAAAPLPGGAIRLDHWSPKVKNASVILEKAETVVGRDRGDLKFPDDDYLSKKHARFFRDAEGRLCVEDLGAINGTYFRLRAPVKLEHRDILFLGRHSFRFELLQYEDQDDRTIEGDPLTRVQGVQGKAPRARLVKRQEEGFRGLPFFFGTQRYVLGRTDGTHNFQRDDLMSRRHAALEFKEGDYWLEDLGSQNGTFLRIRGPRPLESGDVVKMGDQHFRVP